MPTTESYRQEVLRRISNGYRPIKQGKVTYSINGFSFHLKVKTGISNDYPFNINDTVLSADYEVYICGDHNLFYIIPIDIIKKVHSDPNAMGDRHHPGYSIIHIMPDVDELLYAAPAQTIDITRYKNNFSFPIPPIHIPIAQPADIGLYSQFSEGTPTQVLTNRYERNVEARRACIKHYGAKCFICKFDFEKVYGSVAKGFIHVHHRVPLSEIRSNYQVDPIKDLVPVCPNCHAVIHLYGECLPIEKVQLFLLNRIPLV